MSYLPVPRRPLGRALVGAHTRQLGDSDTAVVATIRRVTVEEAHAGSTDLATTLFVGGGAANSLVRVGKSDQSISMSADVTVTNAAISKTGSLVLGGSELTLTARSATLGLNDVGDETFDTSFFSSAGLSLLAAVNEATLKRAPSVDGAYTNSSGGTLEAGEVVALAAVQSIARASAAANDSLSRVLGVTQAQILDSAQGRVSHEGLVPMLFAAGEGAGDHATARVYLSAAAPGRGTLTAPLSSGNVLQLLGVVADSSAYDNALGGTMLVHLLRGPRRAIV